MLDGHAHYDLPWCVKQDKNNKDVYLVDAGYKLNEFASLTISKEGKVTTEFVTTSESRSAEMDEFIADINEQVDEVANRVVANIDVDLSISDENGLRMVRNRETPIGNLVADAYRIISGADIGVVNGGGIRDNLSKGDVTYKQIKNVHPYGNLLMKKTTKGSSILDYLEFANMKVKHDRISEGKPAGEFGGFASVSGLKFSVDTSIPSSVVLDEHEFFLKVDGPRRVKDVKVLLDGEYVDIDPNKDYSIASHDYLLEKAGDGASMFIEDEVISTEVLFDYEILVDYIVDVLDGHLASKYSYVEGRINIL